MSDDALQFHMMPTRITYRQHNAARATLQELIQNKTVQEDPLLAFVELCLGTGVSGNRIYPAKPRLQKLQGKLIETIYRAMITSSPQKPSWAAKVEAVLHLSERMLGMIPSRPMSVALDSRTAVHRQRRIACGTYSTPDFIADKMCKDLLDALASERRQRADIADLSLEAGNFALSLISQSSLPTIRFHGMDRDATALRLARQLIGFAQRAGKIKNFKFFTAQIDSILQEPPKNWPRCFDAIIGNPPWKTRHPSDTLDFKAAFNSILTGQFDVYLAFLLKADCLLKPGGFLSMVVPSGFLFNHNATQVRNLLLEHYDILKLRIYPRRTFIEIPCVIPISFLVRKRPATEHSTRLTTISYDRSSLGGPHRPRFKRTLSATKVWQQLPNKVFNPLASHETLFLAKLTKETTLNNHGTLAIGAQFGRQTLSASPVGFLGLNGRDLRPFHCCRRRAKYYAAGEKAFGREPPFEYVNKAKVILQKTRCMTLSTRLIAALSTPGQLAVSAALMFIPNDQSQARFFEVLLNSHFANAWFKLREVNRTITLSVLDHLPVVFNAKKWNILCEMGEQIANLRQYFHERVESCTVREESNVFNRRFPRTWKEMVAVKEELDSQIFDLYDFTNKERRVVKALSESRTF